MDGLGEGGIIVSTVGLVFGSSYDIESCWGKLQNTNSNSLAKSKACVNVLGQKNLTALEIFAFKLWVKILKAIFSFGCKQLRKPSNSS